LSGLTGGELRLGGVASEAADGSWAGELMGQAGATEILAGSFYADISSLPANFQLRGRWDGAAKSVGVEEAALWMAGLLQATAQGQVTPAGWTCGGAFDLPALDSAAWDPLMQGVHGMGPQWTGLAVSGGLRGRWAATAGEHSRWEGSLQPQ